MLNTFIFTTCGRYCKKWPLGERKVSAKWHYVRRHYR